MWETIRMLIFPADRKVSPVSGVTIIAFWFFACWSLGMVSALGSGFAKASDVQSITISLLETSILDHRTRYCQAPDGTDMRRYFFTQTQRKVREYKETTGTDFILPPCEDLVYVTATAATDSS